MSVCSFPPSLQRLCSLSGLKNYTAPLRKGALPIPGLASLQARSSCMELLPGGVGGRDGGPEAVPSRNSGQWEEIK